MPLFNARARTRPASVASVGPLKPISRECLRNLAEYHAPPELARLRVPRSRRAAVLVALFIGRVGDIYVLLTRRSSTLNSYAGDTALPGGRTEKSDKTPEDTARREAFEEIGLPMDKRRVPLLCTLEPFLSGNNLIVTPVVVLVTDGAIHPILNAPEVSTLFSHPLLAFLSAQPPYPNPSPEGSEREAYHTFKDIEWGDGTYGGRVRMHRFLTGREGEGIKPVFGLTSAILIRAAEVGYARAPDFQVYAEGQRLTRHRIAYAMRTVPALRDAAKEEGIRWHLEQEDVQKRRRNDSERVRSKL